MITKTALDAFRDSYGVRTKGTLSVVVQLTDAFKKDDLPIDPDNYRTKKKGQVKGLGGGNLSSILKSRGISRKLSNEGGRTSRGSMELMEAYADFINHEFDECGVVDFQVIEDYWLNEVRLFFAAKPFKLSSDESKSLDSTIDNLIAQARRREAENPGTTYTGTVLQHLIAAKLSLVIPDVELNGADVADASTGRMGDYMVGDVAIHSTTMPGQALIEKCKENISAGVRPIIITIRERVRTAWDLAEDAGISERLEVWDIQQFLSTNVYEHGLFDRDKRHETISSLVEEYNTIVDLCESDPSLRIDFE